MATTSFDGSSAHEGHAGHPAHGVAEAPAGPVTLTERFLGAHEGQLMLLTVTAMAALVLSFVGFIRAEPSVGSGGPTIDPALSALGKAVYNGSAQPCSSCHGGTGGGGVGPKLAGGAVIATFPDPLDQVRWVIGGSAGAADLYTKAGKTSKGGMPAFGDKLSLTDIVHVVLYERQTLSGQPLGSDAAAWQNLGALIAEYPDRGYSEDDVKKILDEIGPPPAADATAEATATTVAK